MVDQSIFQESTWYQAATLQERLAARRNDVEGTSSSGNLAERRLRKWQEQDPFTEEGYFAQCLATHGVDNADLRELLGEPAAAVHGRFPERAAWLSTLAQAFTEYSSDLEKLPLREELRKEAVVGFLHVIAPLMHLYLHRLREGISRLDQVHDTLPFAARTVERLFYSDLPSHLLGKLNRVMVLELHVARLQGELIGDTPDERFRSFTRRLQRPDVALALLQEYPVLARQVVLHLENWLTFCLEFLEHLCTDWDAIRSTFSPEADPGVLVKLRFGAGDTHRGGRSVIVTEFSSSFKLVYKPHSLAVDVHFQELLGWLNEQGVRPDFRTINVLNCDSHGWVEYVPAVSCHSLEAVRRFYQRQGGYLALLYLLEATDFHFENLIASGEYPVLVDLESLFHARSSDIDEALPGRLAGEALRHSTLRVGLLPQIIWSNDASDGVDLSGLGATAGQLTPMPVPNWDGSGTDEMRFVRRRVEMADGNHRPTLDGAEINVLDYEADIAEGFTRVYRVLLEHREELLAISGPLMRFAQDEVRIILRATRIYARVLYESFHPDVLRDALDRDCLLDRLWVGVKRMPSLARVISAEQRDLINGDIPLFHTRPDSTALWTSRGEKIENYFDESGLSLVLKRVEQLSEADLKRQLWYIHASLTTLAVGPAELIFASPSALPAIARSTARPADFLRASGAVGNRLRSLALREGDEVAWVGLSLVNGRRWTLLPMRADLYGGLAGITLFLAYLGYVTKEDAHTRLAEVSLTTLQRYIEEARTGDNLVGSFEGWGGIIYVLTHLGALWQRPSLLDEAEELVTLLPESIAQDDMLDVMGGSAGCIGALLSLYQCRPAAHVLSAARQCGDHLVAQAHATGQGVGWRSMVSPEKALAGFSHGAAGISWALLRLAALTGDESYRQVAVQGLAYERSLFSSEAGNWPDLRDLDVPGQPANGDRSRFMCAWCHGAPGVGLSRLQMVRHLDDPQLDEEIQAAMETTLVRGFGGNHSLCHGDLGNLELLLQAGENLGELHWREETERVAASVLESIRTRGWICGVPRGVETPGLMAGLAGIGFGLLRLAAPELVPAVLVLEPPKLV